MKFGLSEEQTMLADSVGRYLEDASNLDTVRKLADAGDEHTLWSGLAELGLCGLLVPEDHGGAGLELLDAVVAAEALGYHITPAPFVSTAVMGVLALRSDPERFSTLLGEICGGSTRIGIGFDNATGARDAANLKATASAAGKGTLSGTSLYVIDANADHYVLADSEQHLWLIHADASGVTRTVLNTIDRTRTFCRLDLHNVPAEQISTDTAVYRQVLDAGRIVLAADTLGAAQNMLDQAVAYAKERKQFDRVIGSFQAVKHMCAEMAAELEPTRALVWYAAHAFSHVPAEAGLTACHAKAHIAEVGKFIAKTATEVHGGMGFTDLVGLHYWFKRIGANRQLLGSPERVREEAATLQGLNRA